MDEPVKEMQPIFRDDKKSPRLPYPDPVAVPELPASIRPKSSTIMPDKSSRLWDAIRHFVFGAIGGGSAAATAVVLVFKTIGLSAPMAIATAVSAPFGLIIAGCAVLVGVSDAIRKTRKTDNGGKDFTDILYKLVDLIVSLVPFITAYLAKRKTDKIN